jgi:hypothetical protein
VWNTVNLLLRLDREWKLWALEKWMISFR